MSPFLRQSKISDYAIFFVKFYFNIFSYHFKLLLKEKRRFNFADVDGTPGLNVNEFLAFTHPSEVDYMAVS